MSDCILKDLNIGEWIIFSFLTISTITSIFLVANVIISEGDTHIQKITNNSTFYRFYSNNKNNKVDSITIVFH